MLYCLSKHAIVARVDKTKSFGCRCGKAKVGPAVDTRRKRQAMNSIMGNNMRMKRENAIPIKDNGTLNELKNAESKILNDEHSRIVNGYEPQRRPWITLITISRYI